MLVQNYQYFLGKQTLAGTQHTVNSSIFLTLNTNDIISNNTNITSDVNYLTNNVSSLSISFDLLSNNSYSINTDGNIYNTIINPDNYVNFGISNDAITQIIHNCSSSSNLNVNITSDLFRFFFLQDNFSSQFDHINLIRVDSVIDANVDIITNSIEFIENNILLLNELGFNYNNISNIIKISDVLSNTYLNFNIASLINIIIDMVSSNQQVSISHINQIYRDQNIVDFSSLLFDSVSTIHKTSDNFSNSSIYFDNTNTIGGLTPLVSYIDFSLNNTTNIQRVCSLNDQYSYCIVSTNDLLFISDNISDIIEVNFTILNSVSTYWYTSNINLLIPIVNKQLDVIWSINNILSVDWKKNNV